MLSTTDVAFRLTSFNWLAGGISTIVRLTHTLFAKPVHIFLLTAVMLFFPYSWATAGAIPQVRQIYVKNDGTFLQWRAVYDVDFNWDFSSDQDRGPTITISGLQGLASGQSIESRIWLNSRQVSPSTVVWGVDRQVGIQYDIQATVSGKETIGYISLSSLAKAGLSLPSDLSKVSFEGYYLYCGSNASCPGTDISEFLPLAALDNSWRLILDKDNPSSTNNSFDPNAGVPSTLPPVVQSVTPSGTGP